MYRHALVCTTLQIGNMAEDPHIESDFGCYITVQNQLPVALVYGGGNEDHGYWDKKPPYRIEANQTVDISLLDHNGKNVLP